MPLELQLIGHREFDQILLIGFQIYHSSYNFFGLTALHHSRQKPPFYAFSSTHCVLFTEILILFAIFSYNL